MFIQNTNAGHKDVRFTQGSSISDKSCPKRNNSYTKISCDIDCCQFDVHILPSLKFVTLIPLRGKMYSIQHYVIKFLNFS